MPEPVITLTWLTTAVTLLTRMNKVFSLGLLPASIVLALSLAL